MNRVSGDTPLTDFCLRRSGRGRHRRSGGDWLCDSPPIWVPTSRGVTVRGLGGDALGRDTNRSGGANRVDSNWDQVGVAHAGRCGRNTWGELEGSRIWDRGHRAAPQRTGSLLDITAPWWTIGSWDGDGLTSDGGGLASGWVNVTTSVSLPKWGRNGVATVHRDCGDTTGNSCHRDPGGDGGLVYVMRGNGLS